MIESSHERVIAHLLAVLTKMGIFRQEDVLRAITGDGEFPTVGPLSEEQRLEVYAEMLGQGFDPRDVEETFEHFYREYGAQ